MPHGHGTSILPIANGSLGGTLYCTLPYVSTAYGPITQCTRIDLFGNGTSGLYSPITRRFNPIPGTGPVEEKLYQQTVTATDGFSARTIGYGIVTIGSTQTVYATQYTGNQARFGGVDYVARVFTPNGPWFTIIR